MIEQLPPSPLEWHPAYRDKMWLLDWLDGHTGYGDVVKVTKPQRPWFDPHPSLEPISERVLTLTKTKCWGLAPYVGRPFVYVWYVATDELGRSIAGQSRIAYTDEDMPVTDDLTPEQYEALKRHGYPADLPARGVTGPPEETVYGFDGRGGRCWLRNRVCELDGIEIDGHENSDLDPNSTMCIHCDYLGPNP